MSSLNESGVRRPAFAPVRRRRVFEQVADQIKREILAGNLKSGDRLPPERELAQQFGVSRVTARQALTLLMAEGLIENHVGRGTFLRADADGFTISSLAGSLVPERKWEHEMQMRELIEPQAARLAAQAAPANPRGVAALAAIVEQQRRVLRDAQAFAAEDTAFHTAIAKLTGNPLLVRIVNILHTMTVPTRVDSLASEDGRRKSLEDHIRILDAIERGDPDGSSAAMALHLQNVRALLNRAGLVDAGGRG